MHSWIALSAEFSTVERAFSRAHECGIFDPVSPYDYIIGAPHFVDLTPPRHVDTSRY